MCVLSRSVVSNSVSPWTVAHQAPLSIGFSRQEYWSGLPFPSPEDLPDPGIEPGSPALEADSFPSKPPGKPRLKARPSQKQGSLETDSVLVVIGSVCDN